MYRADPDANRGDPTIVCPLTASDEYREHVGRPGDVPAVADIETQLEGTENAAFARYAFGVRR